MRAKQIYTYCLFAVFFVCAMIHATQGAMLTGWIEHYRLEAAAQGAIGSVQSAGMLVALLVLVWQAGKVAKNTIITFSFIAIVALLFVVSFMPPFWLLIVIYCFVGVFYGSICSLLSSVIADLHDGEDSSKYMSRLHGVYGAGGLVLPLFFRALLGGGMYWNIAFRVVASILAAILVVFIILSNYSLKSLAPRRGSNKRITSGDLKDFFTRGTNILLIMGVLLYGMHQSVITTWSIRYVEVFLGNRALSSLTLSLYWAGVTVSRLLTHKVLPVLPIKIVFFGNFIAAVAIFTGVLSGSATAVAVLTFVMGLANGTTMPALISACCADNDCNTILPTNVMNFALYTAFFLCPLVVGAIESYTSLSGGMLLSAFFAAISGLAILTYWRKKKKAQGC